MIRPLLSVAPMVVSFILFVGCHIYPFQILHETHHQKGHSIHRNASPWCCHSQPSQSAPLQSNLTPSCVTTGRLWSSIIGWCSWNWRKVRLRWNQLECRMSESKGSGRFFWSLSHEITLTRLLMHGINGQKSEGSSYCKVQTGCWRVW